MQLYQLSFPNGKSYIGITSQTAQDRFKDHCKMSRKFPCQKAIQKYGKGNVVLTVLATVDNWELLCLAEIEAIEKFNTFKPNGYNLTLGGDGNVIVGIYGEERIIREKERRKKNHEAYSIKNKEKINEKSKVYYLENKEKVSEYKKQHREKNREEINEKKKIHYLKNKEEILKKHKIYVEKNKEERAKKNKLRYEKNKEIISEKRKLNYKSIKNKENEK